MGRDLDRIWARKIRSSAQEGARLAGLQLSVGGGRMWFGRSRFVDQFQRIVRAHDPTIYDQTFETRNRESTTDSRHHRGYSLERLTAFRLDSYSQPNAGADCRSPRPRGEVAEWLKAAVC
jgi:hypothetical protein